MTTSSRIKNLRRKAAESQNWRCYYCDFPMWETDPEAFRARFAFLPEQSFTFAARQSILRLSVTEGAILRRTSLLPVTIATKLGTDRSGRKMRRHMPASFDPRSKKVNGILLC